MPDSDADSKLAVHKKTMPNDRITRAVYSNEEIIQRFETALNSIDLRREIVEFGCGLNSIFKRGRALRDFQALCVVLWLLSLEKSFPEQQENVFARFLAGSRTLGDGGARKKLLDRIKMFQEVLESRKSADFTPLAVYMAGYLCNDLNNRKVSQLKFSLTIRRLYNFVFESLI